MSSGIQWTLYISCNLKKQRWYIFWKGLDLNRIDTSDSAFKGQTVERSLPATNPGDSNSQIGQNLIWPTIKWPSLTPSYLQVGTYSSTAMLLFFWVEKMGPFHSQDQGELLHPPGTCSTYMASLLSHFKLLTDFRQCSTALPYFLLQFHRIVRPPLSIS